MEAQHTLLRSSLWALNRIIACHVVLRVINCTASMSLLNFGFAKSKETTTSTSDSREETESSEEDLSSGMLAKV